MKRIIDVCICAHNPRIEILRKALGSIARQTVDLTQLRVLIIDNVSSPPIDERLLKVLLDRQIPARIVREPTIGIAQARRRAIRETDGTWILFVDDDNVLDDRYVEEGLFFMAAHPDVGCFGGKLLLPEDINPPGIAKPFLPFLGIKDLGNEPIIGLAEGWAAWEPPAAGAFICRPLADAFAQLLETDAEAAQIGRKGEGGLTNCEDSLMMRLAYRLDLKSAYVPQLRLYHYLDHKRFAPTYLMKLMYGFGKSHALLNSVLSPTDGVPPMYQSPKTFLLSASFDATKDVRTRSVLFGASKLGYHLAAWRQYRSIAGERRRQHPAQRASTSNQ